MGSNWERAIEKLKATTRLNIKPGIFQKLKPHKKVPLTQSAKTTDTTQTTKTHAFTVSNTTNTICGKNSESSCVQTWCLVIC